MGSGLHPVGVRVEGGAAAKPLRHVLDHTQGRRRGQQRLARVTAHLVPPNVEHAQRHAPPGKGDSVGLSVRVRVRLRLMLRVRVRVRVGVRVRVRVRVRMRVWVRGAIWVPRAVLLGERDRDVTAAVAV